MNAHHDAIIFDTAHVTFYILAKSGGKCDKKFFWLKQQARMWWTNQILTIMEIYISACQSEIIADIGI